MVFPSMAVNYRQLTFLLVVSFFVVTSLLRVLMVCVHLLAGFTCSFHDKTVSRCNQTNSLGQPLYDRFRTMGFYLEGTTLFGFLMALAVSRSYRVGRLFAHHLFCVPTLYIFLALVGTCMVLEPFCTIDKQLKGAAYNFWLIGYEYELVSCFLTANALAHFRPDVLKRTIEASTKTGGARRLAAGVWAMFLFVGAVHNILFAYFYAVKKAGTLWKTKIPRSDFDTLSLIFCLSMRTLMAKVFYDKLFEWPQDDSENRRVCLYQPNPDVSTDGGDDQGDMKQWLILQGSHGDRDAFSKSLQPHGNTPLHGDDHPRLVMSLDSKPLPALANPTTPTAAATVAVGGSYGTFNSVNSEGDTTPE